MYTGRTYKFHTEDSVACRRAKQEQALFNLIKNNNNSEPHLHLEKLQWHSFYCLFPCWVYKCNVLQ